MANRNLWIRSGIAGVAAMISYILAIAISWPESQLGNSMLMLVASLFPILSIFFSYGLYTFIASERESAANRLAFVFAVAAFTTVLAMIIVQLTVGTGFSKMAGGLDEQVAGSLQRSLRLVDLGLDLAWDMLIGTSFILLGMAMRRKSGLGLGWAIPMLAFGAALIGLNVATFPWPPGDAGLFDVGPFIGLFMIALAVRLIMLGRRAAI